MKKLLILILSFILMLTLVSCTKTDNGAASTTSSSNQSTQGNCGGNNAEYTLSVSDPYNTLYEPLRATYETGEEIVVKTQLLHDVDTVVELNGAKPISSSVVKDENGRYIYNQYIFTMPAVNSLLEIKHKEGMGEGFNVSLVDENNLVINRVAGMKMAGETCEIHTTTEEVRIEIDGEILAKNGEAVTNSQGEVLYYKWSFKMPYNDINVEVISVSDGWYEPTIWHLTFVNETGIDGLFSNAISGEYSHGEPVYITVNPDYLVDDQGIILKVNGKLLEETDIYEWLFVMPDGDATVTAYLINPSWGEEWHYLNIVDEEGLLSRVYDGYYKAGQTITIVTKTFYEEILIDLWSEMGLAYERQEYAKEDAYEYTLVLTMPDHDMSLRVLTVDKNDD